MKDDRKIVIWKIAKTEKRNVAALLQFWTQIFFYYSGTRFMWSRLILLGTFCDQIS